jgi:hypothetical protein
MSTTRHRVRRGRGYPPVSMFLAFLTGHSTEPWYLIVPLILLSIGIRILLMRSRRGGRGRGPFGRGPFGRGPRDF